MGGTTLVGRRFGALDVFDGPHWRGEVSYWFARCDCGELDFVPDAGLIACRTRECGACGSSKNRKHLPLGFVHHRIRVSANAAIVSALKAGNLTRVDTCQDCGRACTYRKGRPSVVAHHPDYSKPLDVEWLCFGCHSKAHRTYRATGHDPLAAYRSIIGPDVVRPRKRMSRRAKSVDAFRASLREAA